MMLVIYVLVKLLALYCGYLLWKQAKKFKKFRGNLGFPVIGNLFLCMKNYWHTWHPSFHDYLDEVSSKYGDVCCFWLLHKVCILISEPNLLERLAFHPSVIDKEKMVFDSPGLFIKSSFSYSQSNGTWRGRRKELYGSVKKSYLTNYHDLFLRKAKKTLQFLSESEGEFDCEPVLMMIPIECITETHFGVKVDIARNIPLFKDLHLSMVIISSSLTNPILAYLSYFIAKYIYFPRHQKKFENEIFQKVALNDKNAIFEKNIPIANKMLIRNREENVSEELYFNELRELLYVGAHTVGLSLCSAMLFMATNAQVQEYLFKEQHEIFGDSDRDIAYDDIIKMEYLNRFYKEVLRFVSPPIIIKSVKDDIKIDDLIMPAGCCVIYNYRKIRFDKRFWNEADKFDPDRFLDENLINVPKSAYSYFGAGIRSCPGGHYADYCIKVMLSYIVRNYKIYTKIKFEDIMYNHHMMSEMKCGYKISVEKRLENN